MRTHRSPAPNGSGIGRPSSRQAEATSHDLRHGTGRMLARRRRVLGLSLGSAASLGVIAPYQAGILRSLPDPPGGVFDSDQVDAAGEAYYYLSTPDAALGIASYALTAVLAGMGSDASTASRPSSPAPAGGPGDRARTQPWVPLATSGTVAADALCAWCLFAAIASFAAVPEARLAWRYLRASA